MIIAIAGLHGTGKSTVARRLAAHLGFAYHSTGVVFRALAKEQGMGLEAFSRLAEQDYSIDHQIDERIIALAKAGGDMVFEGQLPVYMVEPWRDFAILLVCQDDVRIQRMMARDGRDFEAQKRETLVREQSEQERFSDIYGIDITDPAKILGTFNLIVDTTHLDIDSVFHLCVSAVENWQIPAAD